LLPLSVDVAHIDSQLIADNGTATVALGQLHPLDPRRQLSTFNHRDTPSVEDVSKS
jgi:hypothetical protein